MLDNENEFVPKRLPGGRVFKNKILQLLKSKGVDVPSNYQWTIHYKDKNPYNLDLENIMLVSADDWFRLNSQTQWAARDRTLKDPHFDVIKFIEKESESTMESIYEQMNKIDDKESLNEKYNVRTLKDVKKLHESTEHSDAWKAAYSKLNRAAEDAKLHMDPDFVEYALEDDGAYVEDVIENEVTYVGDVLKKEFPNLAYWKFLQDERFSSAIQVYSRPKNSRRFSDVTFEGNYELAHDRLYPIDVE